MADHRASVHTLHSLVNDLTKRSETDAQLLILINSDGTQAIVRVAA